MGFVQLVGSRILGDIAEANVGQLGLILWLEGFTVGLMKWCMSQTK